MITICLGGMFSISYNASSILMEQIKKIDSLRTQLLLTPISPKTELKLRWEAMIQRIYWSLALSGNTLTKNEMIRLITNQNKDNLTSEERDVIEYKKGLDYISHEWLASTKTVSTETILSLHELACPGRFILTETKIESFFDYLKSSTEHPVIQAAIAQIGLIHLRPFTNGNGRTARLLALLFLYKYGFDFRGLLCLEEYWRRDITTLQFETKLSIERGNVTNWLEYFAKAVVTQLEKTTQQILAKRGESNLPGAVWELNDRQKEILAHMENPALTMTNKKVQKMFRISQITASRDLSKLAILGLLFAHGKGRSVYYTRI